MPPCQRNIYSRLLAGDPSGLAAGRRQAIQDVFIICKNCLQDLDYPPSPRMITRTPRTPVLSDNDCPGLTEIKDVRIHNNLLEEMFSVEDSIELDFFELERQAANSDNCLSGYSSPPPSSSNMRLLLDMKPPDMPPVRGAETYQLHKMQSRNFGGPRRGGQPVGVGGTRPVKSERNGSQDLVAVASPTVSSTCDGGGNTGPVITGFPVDLPGAVAVGDAAPVHSTTNAPVTDTEKGLEKKPCGDVPISGAEKPPNYVVEGDHTARPNVRPRVERPRPTIGENPTASGDSASVAAGVPAPNSGSTTSSSSTSPSQLHVAKRPRVIDSGSDLLAEVRQAYEYIQGADLYAPSSHPTFTSLDTAPVPSAFQPNTTKNGLSTATTFNFCGQSDYIPTFGGHLGPAENSSRVVTPFVGIRSAAGSPSVAYQSCPDLASSGGRQPPLQIGEYARFPPQLTDDVTLASSSAPTTPSKRAGPWSHMRSPMSPGMQAQWRHDGSVVREHHTVQFGRHNIAYTGQNMPTSGHQHSWNSFDAGGLQFNGYSRSQSPVTDQTHARPAVYSHDQTRICFLGNAQPLGNPQLVAGNSNAGVGMDGAPLSQNAFLRSVVDDEGSVFRSHPLFPLLRDIIIADMNFHTPSFPFQLIANLPADFGRLVQNYRNRNPQLASARVTDHHTNSVVMDALAYAHAALIGEFGAVGFPRRIILSRSLRSARN